MRDNAFGTLMKVGLGLWSTLCLYLCGSAVVNSARALPDDRAAQHLHAFGFLAGQGMLFAIWAGPSLAMTLGYLVFGRTDTPAPEKKSAPPLEGPIAKTLGIRPQRILTEGAVLVGSVVAVASAARCM